MLVDSVLIFSPDCSVGQYRSHHGPKKPAAGPDENSTGYPVTPLIMP